MLQGVRTVGTPQSESDGLVPLINHGLEGTTFHFDMFELLSSCGLVKLRDIHEERCQSELKDTMKRSKLLLDYEMIRYNPNNFDRYKLDDIKSVKSDSLNVIVKKSLELWREWETYTSNVLTNSILKYKDNMKYGIEELLKDWLLDVHDELTFIRDLYNQLEAANWGYDSLVVT